MKPTIGNWYRIQGSDSFEVVAFDERESLADEEGERAVLGCVAQRLRRRTARHGGGMDTITAA